MDLRIRTALLAATLCALLACRGNGSPTLGGSWVTPPVTAGALTGGGKVPGGAYLTQATWYVDPGNTSTTAADTKDCATSTTACRTFSEIEQRWTFGGHLAQNTTVFMLSDGVVGDPLNVRVGLEANAVLAYYCAPNTTLGSGATSLQTGTFSSVTAIARATNVLTQGTDASSRVWTSFLGKRVRDVTTGAVAWVAKDLTGGAARFSSPSTWSTATTATVTTTTFGTVNTYQVDELRKLWSGNVNTTIGTSVSTGGTLLYQDCEFQTPFKPSINAANVVMRGSRFKGAVFGSTNDAGSILTFSNCEFESAMAAVGGFTKLEAGLGRAAAGNTAAIQGPSLLTIDGDYLSQGSNGIGIKSGFVILGAVAAADAAASASFNPRGSGIAIGYNATNQLAGAHVRVGPVNHSAGALYGSGNAGYGLDISGSHSVNVISGGTYAITGTSGDFVLGGDATNMTYAVKATGAVVASYGLALTGSWTNFAGAQPTGFGGNAHNVAEDAHLVTN